ncbi:hypothetical protein [Mucilaginibacter sp. NFX135]|uniref:hypothetical protein n=1 Tax=Mucilaginibacter sp. NFX135 TaxID=3402687 RepID=UPI003AFAE02C
MNKFIACLIAMVSACLAAQAQYIHDLQGKPYMEQSYTEVEGNPFLISSWADGNIDFANGKKATIRVKYDLVKDVLLFQHKGDSTAMYFVDPVKGFTLTNSFINESNILPLVFNSGYPAIDVQTTTSFYQVVASGKMQLLRHYRKAIRTDQAFNSATVTKTFAFTDLYYLYADNKIVRIKPSQKSILAAMANKSTEIQAYLKTNTVDYKNDAALAKLFNYYNSL